MEYWHWLVLVSLLFLWWERFFPARPAQPLLRPGWARDLFYLAFNGHWFMVLFGGALTALGASLAEPRPGWLDGRPFWLQCVVFLVVSDFLQWCVHNLLHRVPFLWRLHQIHHSVVDMDFAGNFRFHWMELVVYRGLLYLPLLYLGGDWSESGAPLLCVAVFSTAWGHYNHSNLRLSIGPLAWLFNCPQMHLWHHDASSEGGTAKNFGIVLSVWDWLFGTAYWPRDRAPARLGYPGLEHLPASLPRQLFWPLMPRE